MHGRLARRAGRLLAAALLLAIPGCSGDDGGKPGGVRVRERDFHISAPKVVSAGHVDISIDNRGPDDHELIVVRLHGESLPGREDGLTLDEDALEDDIAGALEPAAPGDHELSVDLKPGRYELLCNMYGHYAGGMHTRLVVRS
jgi:uncharacterized cupredoxin-like copper-binding protein